MAVVFIRRHHRRAPIVSIIDEHTRETLAAWSKFHHVRHPDWRVDWLATPRDTRRCYAATTDELPAAMADWAGLSRSVFHTAG